ncbi:MAG: DUF1653 domain-containing protein [Candidatus Micrarchaeaceae archaeon]
MKRPRTGKYQHYKGDFYRVIGVARHSESPKDEFVVYQALYKSKKFGNNELWIRPKKMFLEDVNLEGKKVPRFRFVRKE